MLRQVKILRSGVIVRVGGGWDPLEEFLRKHDPCRGTYSRTSDKSMIIITQKAKSV